MQVIDVYHDDCPGCCQPMQVRELLADDGSHFEEEACSTCDHFYVLEVDTGGRENACQS